MISITRSKQWDAFASLFSEEMLERFDFFLFEFGKRLTYLIHQDLLKRISTIKGPKDYKKRLVVAEIRDTNGRAWWAIVAKAHPLTQREYDPNRSILTVVTRYDIPIENPVDDILVNFGPWTPDTLPFMPSLRQAAVVIKRVSEEDASAVKAKNKQDAGTIQAIMEQYDLEYDDRLTVYEKLKVVPDLAIEAMKLEFGLRAGGKAHWRPAIQYGARIAVGLASDPEMIRILTDLKYKGYKVRHHEREYLTPNEVKALEKFQNKVRSQLRI